MSTADYDEEEVELVYLPDLEADEPEQGGSSGAKETDDPPQSVKPKPGPGPERISLSAFIKRFFLPSPSVSSRLRVRARELANDEGFKGRVEALRRAVWKRRQMEEDAVGPTSAPAEGPLVREALLALLEYVSSEAAPSPSMAEKGIMERKSPHRFWRARIDEGRLTNRDGSIILMSAPRTSLGNPLPAYASESAPINPMAPEELDYEVDLDDFRTGSTFTRFSLSTNNARDERMAWMVREMDFAPEWMRGWGFNAQGGVNQDGEMGEDVRWLSRLMLAGCVARRHVFGLVYVHDSEQAGDSEDREEGGGGCFWTTYVDRGGVVIGGPFHLNSRQDQDGEGFDEDTHEPLESLAVALVALYSNDIADQGLYDSFAYAGSTSSAPGGPFHEDLKNLTLRLDPWAFKIESTVDPGKEPNDMYQTVRYLARNVDKPALREHGQTPGVENVVLSFRWGPDLSQDEQDQSEDQWHRLAEERGIDGVPRLFRSHVFPAKEFNGWDRASASERIATMLCVSIMEPFVPMDSVEDPVAFKQAFVSVVEGELFVSPHDIYCLLTRLT